MAKKDLSAMLGNFAFTKVPEITDGLVIPTGNAPRPRSEPVMAEPVEPVTTLKVKKSRASVHVPTFNRLEIDNKAFTPMTNTVPTVEEKAKYSYPKTNATRSKTAVRRGKQPVTGQDLNLEEIAALATKQEKAYYLAMRGWSLKVEPRGNHFYHYATKYVQRKKKRFYLGSITAS